MKEFGQRITGWCLVILTFLLPLKLGSLAMMPEQPPMFPTDLVTLLVISWPPHLTGVMGGILLMAAVLFFPAPRWRAPGALIAIGWGILLPLAALPGMINGTNTDYVWSAVSHWFGVGSMILSSWWIFSCSDIWKKRALAALAASTLLVGVDAWRQYIWGMEEMEEMIRKQKEAGIEISNIMEIRIRDGRIFGTLGSCNTLAGFLLLTIPAVLVLLWKLGKYFEPVKLSQILFTAVGTVLLAAPLLMTRSRGAWLCAAGAAFLCFICCRKVKKHYKFLAAGVSLILLAGGIFAICRSGRGILSGVERLDYLRSGAIICMKYPVCGSGWGEFFHHHMKLKLSSSDESARSPHNLPVQFACHAGIPAGVIALAAMLILLWELFRNKSDDPVLKAFRWGALAFMLHCLMEINDVIPASMVCCALSSMAVLPSEEQTPDEPLWRRIGSVFAAAAVGITAACLNFNWLRGEAAFEKLEHALRPQIVDGTVKQPDPFAGVQALKQVQKFRPKSPYPLELTGDMLLRAGDWDSALQLFEQARELAPGRPAIYRRLAAIAFRKGDMVKARNYLDTARKIFPADPKNKWGVFEKMMTGKR